MEAQLLTRIKKLRELAQRGVGGEKEIARQKLDEMLARYGVSEADIDALDRSLHTRSYSFANKSEMEMFLTGQIVYAVSDGKAVRYRSGKSKTIRTEITSAEYREIQRLRKVYIHAWNAAIEKTLQAFVQKHNIFPRTEPEVDPEPLSNKEALALLRRMQALDDVEIPLGEDRQLETAEDGDR